MSTADEWAPRAPRPYEPELTYALMNLALAAESRERGFCLCIHPMMQLINFAGLTCGWCGQPVTDKGYGPTAKEIRTDAVKRAYPQFVKAENEH